MANIHGCEPPWIDVYYKPQAESSLGDGNRRVPGEVPHREGIEMIGTISQIDRQQLVALLSCPRARRIDSVHVHHTWRPACADWRGEATLAAMRRYHVDVLRWIDLGQHLTIGPDGSLWTGRSLELPPASAAGYNGTAHQGPLMVALAGDFDRGRDTFVAPQADATYAALAAILAACQLPLDALRFYNELNPARTSPGSSLVLADFRAEVKKRMGGARRGAATPRDADAVAAYLAQFGPAKGASGGRGLTDAEPAEPRYDPEQAAYDYGAARAARLFGKCECSDAEREAFRSHVVDLAMGQLSHDGCYNNDESDLDELVARIGTWIAGAAEPRLVFFAHGGLVDERSGLGIALRDRHWWLANGVYPVFFVWETGFLEVFQQKQRELAARNIVTDASDAVLEITLGPTAGKPTWDRIKNSALLSSAADTANGTPGGAHRFATKLAARLAAHAAGAGAKPVGLHAVGHSAGSIFHCHFLPALTGALAGAGVPNPKIDTLAFLAPAVRTDLFKSHLMPMVPARIGQFALFTMNRPTELDDKVLTIYRKSLLYFVRNACEEPARATPIFGLEESIRADPALVAWFGLGGGAPAMGVDVCWSPTAAVSGPSATRSRTHGGFDNDAPTMNAVMYRVLGLGAGDDLPQPHLGDAEVEVCGTRIRGFSAPGAAAGASAGRAAGAGTLAAGGRRRALAIGIDAYATQPLSGCVADARSAGDALLALGFEVQSLFDEDATRQGIETALERLLANSRPGDTVVIHYAGHGTQLPDLNQDEGDGFDEAWVPYDYMSGEFFIDDDQGRLFDRYRTAGIELVLFTDCCHSGTSTRAAFTRNAPQSRGNSRYLRPPLEAVEKFRERRGAGARDAGPAAPAAPDALGWEIHYAACQDAQSAYEHDGHGDFTRSLTGVLTDAASRGASYEELATKLDAAFNGNALQLPNFRAKAEVRANPLFGAGARTDTVGSGGAAVATGESPSSPAKLDLERRIDAIDAKLDALARKIDQL
jgi:hypothetical protein